MNLQNPRFEAGNSFVHFTKTSKGGNGHYVMECSIVTTADFVPPEKVQEHADTIEKIGRACARELRIAKGYSRPAQNSNFGQLPSAADDPAQQITSSEPPPIPALMQTISTSSHQRRHKRWKFPRTLAWIIGLVIFYILLLTALKLLAPVH
ncbi:MAG TPA: hypothetical protein VGY98_07130 [Verrucomicrobiae bacterium]|nr:hypothetical protein [Verrucomicrobiae bacterium]